MSAVRSPVTPPPGSLATRALLAAGLAATALGAPGLAHADEVPVASRAVELEAPPRTFASFRMGGSSGNENGLPTMCLEIAPVRFLAIEGCGTGSGFLHQEDDAEIAHFRLRAPLATTSGAGGWVSFTAAAGFAELQVAADDPGFQFGGADARRVSTSGPEVGGQARAIVPLGAGLEALFELDLSLAWFPHAGELVEPQRRLAPTATFTGGVGF